MDCGSFVEGVILDEARETLLVAESWVVGSGVPFDATAGG